MMRLFRYLLAPISLLFGVIIWLRNLLYDKHILYSAKPEFPIIGVGNLSVGGTGKTPLVDLLISHLKPVFNVATISRGYKRTTKGYLLANGTVTAAELGDEPMLFLLHHPEISVVVGEDRLASINRLRQDKPQTQVIIMDDILQHRKIRAGLNILLTEQQSLFTRDWYLPTGRLRDNPSSAKRADVIIVNKCDPNLPLEEKNRIIREISPQPYQSVFFSCIQYGMPYHILTKNKLDWATIDQVLLICGIANPQLLIQFLEQIPVKLVTIIKPDHYLYTEQDLRLIDNTFHAMEQSRKCIITTEKDAVRLLDNKELLGDLPIYALPITLTFMFDQEAEFWSIITNFMRGVRS